MAHEAFFSFNLARKEIFSVNMARRLKKLPTPDLMYNIVRQTFTLCIAGFNCTIRACECKGVVWYITVITNIRHCFVVLKNFLIRYTIGECRCFAICFIKHANLSLKYFRVFCSLSIFFCTYHFLAVTYMKTSTKYC